jgi:CheY-like chemotaxis protein
LAEENPVNQLLAVRLLENHGHKVVLAHNGREVLGRIEKEYFDLVLIDMELPELDGLRTTLEIRKNEQATGFHLPIVAMSADPKEGDRERCHAAGMDGFVSKPFNYKELLVVVQSVLGSPKTASESGTVVHQ